jgi:hypothetical protein
VVVLSQKGKLTLEHFVLSILYDLGGVPQSLLELEVLMLEDVYTFIERIFVVLVQEALLSDLLKQSPGQL